MEQIRARFWHGWIGGIWGGIAVAAVSHYHARSAWAAISLTLLTALGGGLGAVAFGTNPRRAK